MDVLIEQALNVVHEGRNLLAGLLDAQALKARADRRTPDNDKHDDRNQSRDCVQQDLLRVIALNVLVNTEVVIPDLFGDPIAQAGEQAKPVKAAAFDNHEADKCDFDCKENKTLNKLANCEMGQTHNQAGQPNDRAAVFQRIDQTSGIQLLLTCRCGFCQFFR